jgi:hypothetical protein
VVFYWASGKSPVANMGIAAGIVLLIAAALFAAIRIAIEKAGF